MIEAQGQDFSVHFFEAKPGDHDAELILSCKKCTWNVNLNALDTLEDIYVELMVHDDRCQELRIHEYKAN